MAFGIGFGAFAQGLSGGLQQGLALGKTFKGIKADNAKQQAIDEAKVDYDKGIADKVLTQAGQANTGQAFDAEGASKKARSENPFIDFLYKQKMPQIMDAMVQAGDFKGAEALQKWGEDKQQRALMKDYGKLLNFGMMGRSSGDYTQFADSAMDIVNRGNFGLKAKDYEFVKDDAGKTTGMTFNLKEGDREFSHTFNSTDEAMQFFANQGAPENAFKRWQSELDAAQKLRTHELTKRIDASIGLGKDLTVEGAKQGNRIALEDRKTENDLWKESAKATGQDPKVRAAASTKAAILRENGYTDQQIAKWMPALLGIREETRQSMSGDDVTKFAMETLARTDDTYIEADQATKLKMVQDFITAFRATAKTAAMPTQAPGIRAAQPQSRPPLF